MYTVVALWVKLTLQWYIVVCTFNSIFPKENKMLREKDKSEKREEKRRPSVKVKGQGQIFSKIGKKLNNWPYLGLPTDFILGTKVQPNKAQSMTQVPMTLTFGQDQNFPKMG